MGISPDPRNRMVSETPETGRPPETRFVTPRSV